MAVISTGIMGSMIGKCGGVVGQKWKSKNTLRELVKPSNPQSVAQQLQRSKYAFLCDLFTMMSGTLIATAWSSPPKNMTPLNWFLKINLPLLVGAAVPSTFIASPGTLLRPRANPDYDTPLYQVSFDPSYLTSVHFFQNQYAVPAGATMHCLVVKRDGSAHTFKSFSYPIPNDSKFLHACPTDRTEAYGFAFYSVSSLGRTLFSRPSLVELQNW